MSVRAVLLKRVNKTLNELTFSRLFGAAIPLMIGSWIAYVVLSGLMTDQKTPEEVKGFLESLRPLLQYGIAGVLAMLATLVLVKIVWDVRREAEEYAEKLATDPSEVSQLQKSLTRVQESTSQQVRELARTLQAQIERAEIALTDTSDPEKLFKVARQRLLDEAIRIDKISRRNLVIGIAFSFIALAMLASPLIAQLLTSSETPEPGVMSWFARYYLPRFAVGLLLQFVGFFFLRLYVANELDLKHNKNELTNLELRMMGLQVAKASGDAPSRKEVIRSLMNTERNFLIKKNEKSVSTEALTEYNDLKGLIEKLVNKIPGTGK